MLHMPETAEGSRPDTSIFGYELVAGEGVFQSGFSCARCHRRERLDLVYPSGGAPPRCRDERERAEAVREAVREAKGRRLEEVREWQREEERRREHNEEMAKRDREMEQEGSRLTWEKRKKMSLEGRVAEERAQASAALEGRMAAVVPPEVAQGGDGVGQSDVGGHVGCSAWQRWRRGGLSGRPLRRRRWRRRCRGGTAAVTRERGKARVRVRGKVRDRKARVTEWAYRVRGAGAACRACRSGSEP